ncbi:MAG: hypothetical protein WC346_15060 [Methanogenium sp.]|jgi:hypothetical protein
MKEHARKRDFEKFESEIRKRLRKYKLRLASCESSVSGLDETINKSVRISIKNLVKEKLQEYTEKEVKKRLDSIEKEITNDIRNALSEWIRNVAKFEIEIALRKGMRFKIKSFKLAKCGMDKINMMYKKGWKVIYIGKLTDNGETLVMFDKPILKEEATDGKKKKEKNPLP